MDGERGPLLSRSGGLCYTTAKPAMLAGYGAVTLTNGGPLFMVLQSDAPIKLSSRIEALPHTPDIRGPLPGPMAQEILTRDQAIISPSYTRSYPFVMDHGKNCLVWDVDGNRFIDFTAGVAV